MSVQCENISITEDFLSKIVTVLELILEKGNAENTGSYNSDQIKELRSYPRPRTIGSECADLLKKCLSGHRYKEAVDLLWIICQDTTIHEMFLFKACMTVLNNLPIDDNPEVDAIAQFLENSAYLTKQVVRKEAHLEYIIHHLKQPSAKSTNFIDGLKGFEKTCGRRTKQYPQISSILDGYILYMKCDDICSKTKKDVNEELLELFKKTSLFKNPGNWDILVLKLVEVLEKYERKNDIKELLTNYAESHSSHLNAHIYLCLYLDKHDPSSEQLIKHLKKISKLCPSDERVLLLLEKQRNELPFSKSLKLIFRFLDYPSNADDIRAWNHLRELLNYAKKSEDNSCLESVKTQWMSRHKSWFWLHFNPLKVSHLKESDFDLTTMKVKVLSFLNEDHEYITKVNERFKQLEMN